MDDNYQPAAQSVTFDEMLAELLPYTAASRRARTYKRPAAGTKTATVWATADSLMTSNPEQFESVDGRVVLKSLGQAAALISVMTGITLNTVRTSLSYWASTNGYSRRVGSNENVLGSYLRRRRQTLAS